MNTIKRIFKKEKVTIGVIHFLPLLGYPKFPGVKKVLDLALKDLKALETGGVDGIMVENNYDVPHQIFVGPETISSMTYLTGQIIKKTKLPVGISVLWNDYKASLSIAKVCGGKFIRVPVFVDDVRTNYGDIFAESDQVIKYRKQIKGENIALLTDIHVKHAKLISKYSLAESAKLAIKKGSDGIIVTGKWTADEPSLDDLKSVRMTAQKFPVFVGSGATEKNIDKLIQYADGVIIGTSLKTGQENKKHVNIKGAKERIDLEKVKRFVKRFKKV